MNDPERATRSLLTLLNRHVRWKDDLSLTTFWSSVQQSFVLPLAHGDHGVVHWSRVASNAVRLSETLGADNTVAVLFGTLHDNRRVNEHDDPQHGERAAEAWSRSMHPWTALKDHQADLLARAMSDHSDGFLTGPTTVQACWDADRLDLWRVGITPDPKRLCTPAARRMLAAGEDAWSMESGRRRPYATNPWGVEDALDEDDGPTPIARLNRFKP